MRRTGIRARVAHDTQRLHPGGARHAGHEPVHKQAEQAGLAAGYPPGCWVVSARGRRQFRVGRRAAEICADQRAGKNSPSRRPSPTFCAIRPSASASSRSATRMEFSASTRRARSSRLATLSRSTAAEAKMAATSAGVIVGNHQSRYPTQFRVVIYKLSPSIGQGLYELCMQRSRPPQLVSVAVRLVDAAGGLSAEGPANICRWGYGKCRIATEHWQPYLRASS